MSDKLEKRKKKKEKRFCLLRKKETGDKEVHRPHCRACRGVCFNCYYRGGCDTDGFYGADYKSSEYCNRHTDKRS